jgi:hypothetical protein
MKTLLQMLHEIRLDEVDPRYETGHSDLYAARKTLEREIPKIIDIIKKQAADNINVDEVVKLLDGVWDVPGSEMGKRFKDASNRFHEGIDELDKEVENYRGEISKRLRDHVKSKTLTRDQAQAQYKDSVQNKKNEIKQRKKDWMLVNDMIRNLQYSQAYKIAMASSASKATDKDLYAPGVRFKTDPATGEKERQQITTDRISGIPIDEPELRAAVARGEVSTPAELASRKKALAKAADIELEPSRRPPPLPAQRPTSPATSKVPLGMVMNRARKVEKDFAGDSKAMIHHAESQAAAATKPDEKELWTRVAAFLKNMAGPTESFERRFSHWLQAVNEASRGEIAPNWWDEI